MAMLSNGNERHAKGRLSQKLANQATTLLKSYFSLNIDNKMIATEELPHWTELVRPLLIKLLVESVKKPYSMYRITCL